MIERKKQYVLVLFGLLTINVLTGCTNPLKKFFTKEESNVTEELDSTADDESTTTISETTPSDEIDSTTILPESERLDETSTTSTSFDSDGGNPTESNKLLITISEDKYFYQNHEIEFDDLLDLLENIEPACTVELADEKATLRAYKKLITVLDEHEIPYMDVE